MYSRDIVEGVILKLTTVIDKPKKYRPIYTIIRKNIVSLQPNCQLEIYKKNEKDYELGARRHPRLRHNGIDKL